MWPNIAIGSPYIFVKTLKLWSNRYKFNIRLEFKMLNITFLLLKRSQLFPIFLCFGYLPCHSPWIFIGFLSYYKMTQPQISCLTFLFKNLQLWPLWEKWKWCLRPRTCCDPFQHVKAETWWVFSISRNSEILTFQKYLVNLVNCY